MNQLVQAITVIEVLVFGLHSLALGYDNVIRIDPITGNDTDSCVNGKGTCKSLEWAFKEVHRHSSTMYLLEKGTHFLSIPMDAFKELQSLAFSGITNDSDEVVIHCKDQNTGLGFIDVANISISNLTINNCSALRDSSSRDYHTSHDYRSLKFQVGLYFYHCNDVTMRHVTVSNSPSATGVVMYDTSGTNEITDCEFRNNSVFYPVEDTTSPYGGGGGFYVEFTYCGPGSTDCNETTFYITGSVYLFARCTFMSNVANNSDLDLLANYIVPYKADHMAFGRGGGLSIFVNGDSHGNTFSVINSTFLGNKAAWGGGMFLEFHDQTYNNSVSVLNSKFEANRCHYTPDSGTAGGGMRIGFYVYKSVPGIGNSVNIDTCHFFNNSALNGGGLSISAALQKFNISLETLARALVNNSTFSHNVGRLGSAVHIDGFPLILTGQMLIVDIVDCTLYENSVDYLDPLGVQDMVPYQPGEGTAYIHGVPVKFQGVMTFFSNNGSGLAIVKAEVDFTDTEAVFLENKGNKGGGIALLGAAYIVINNNTSMLFHHNTAAVSGGAIYNKYITRRTMGSYADCFIRYYDPLIHTNEWNANFTFYSNHDLGGNNENAIHSTSVLPCSWAGRNKSGIFCWRHWVFKDKDGQVLEDCTSMISSDIGSIKFSGKTGNHYKSFPGVTFDLNLDIRDDHGFDMKEKEVFLASTNSSGSALGVDGDSYSYVWGTNTTVWGKSGNNVSLQLDTIKDRVWHLKLFIELQPCPPGLVLTSVSQYKSNNTLSDINNTQLSDSLSCSCPTKLVRSSPIICDNNYHSVRLANSYWMGHTDSSDNFTYVTGMCPSGFCHQNPTFSHSYLPDNFTELETLICGSKNRHNVLCGECIDGYGPAVNSRSYECVNCTDPVGDTLKYVSAVYIPLVVMFLIIIIFNIHLTTAAANSFILYAQIISSTFGVDADGQIPLNLIAGNYTHSLLKAYMIPYGVFNLEFVENLIPPLCVGTNFNALMIISLDYIVALAPLLMIIIIVVIFKISSFVSDQCCRYLHIHTQTRAIAFLAKRKRTLSEAILPAFSAFLLLSYSKLALTPAFILSQQELTDSSGKKVFPERAYYAGHLPITNSKYILHYKIPACFVLATFVAIPPLLLLDYPLRLFEWCLSKVKCLWRHYPVGKVHFFLDKFQGCFKNKFRLFAGLLFLFRLVINMNYTFATWLEQFIVQEISCILMITLLALFQPYNEQNDIFNRIDVLIFTDLAVVNGLSFYLYEYARNNPQTETLPIAAFIIEYILIFMPLIYIIGYVFWKKTKPCHKKLQHMPVINDDVLEQSCDTLPPNNKQPLLDSDSYSNRRFEESEDLLFRRAELVNKYKPPNRKVAILESGEKKDLSTISQRSISEDSGLRSAPQSGSGKNYMYGSTKSRSTKDTMSSSTHSTISTPSVDHNSILYKSSDDNNDCEN